MRRFWRRWISFREVHLATLLSIIEAVPGLLTTDSYDSIETLLESGSTLLEAEADVNVLLKFAETCHAWGPPALEEAALRTALARGAQLDALEQIDAIERLLDILRERVGLLHGVEKAEGLVEVESLAGEALRLLGASSDGRWANLVRTRGLCRLLLVQVGQREHGAGSRADLLAYRSWAEFGVDVPDEGSRGNLLAFVDFDIAELDILEGYGAEAARRLESAIAKLEAGKATSYLTDRGYDLLMLAEEQ
jgi:hypothetical protein